jgi:hypothetical protein
MAEFPRTRDPDGWVSMLGVAPSDSWQPAVDRMGSLPWLGLSMLGVAREKGRSPCKGLPIEDQNSQLAHRLHLHINATDTI